MGDAGRKPGALTWLPVALAAALYVGLTAWLLWQGLGRTGGTFAYAQDDPYIHLAMARALAEHGVWGVSPSEFAAASSSPLWTLGLAALWRLGARAAWWPLLINVLSGVALLGIADRVLRNRLACWPRTGVLAGLVVVAPLPTLALIGMEHTLFIALAVAFAWRAAAHIAEDTSQGLAVTSALAALLVATRYEGLFVVASAAALQAWRARPWRAARLALAAAVPVVAFGAYSLAHGGMVLPNSVLMKSNPARFDTVAGGVIGILGDWIGIGSLWERPSELALVIAVLLALGVSWPETRRHESRAGALAIAFVGTTLLHATLVKLEWFYRYEAYVVVLGVLAAALLVASSERAPTRMTFRSAPVQVLVLLLVLPLLIRALGSLARTPLAMENVYEQQYQMGLFFESAYPDATVAVNDIGAVSWLSTSRVLDVMGLATPEVAELKRHRALNRDALQRLAERNQVRAIAVYRNVFAPILPRDWIPVGEWTIRNNVAVSGETVTFLATNAADAAALRGHLDAFAPRLPGTVTYVVEGGGR